MKEKYREEYVFINGIEHFLLHYPKARSTPVLLYLHGGPGTFESLFAYTLNEEWGELFTQVHWDQRGAGKTWRRNKSAGSPRSLKQMLEDLHGVVEHLKSHYQIERLVILGHSWGSLLGSVYVQSHPENVIAYIGTGQIVNTMENERVGYQQTLKMARKAGNQKHIKQLEQLGNYPPHNPEQLMKLLPKIRKIQDGYEESASIIEFIQSIFHSPSFQWADIISFLRSPSVNKALVMQMLIFDLYGYPTQYQIPIHYILGERDAITPASLAAAYFERIEAPCKALTFIPNAGHNPMYDQPAAFAKALRVVRESLTGY